MSAFSDCIREELGGGLFKVADFENGPKTFTISHLLEAVRMFKKNVDLLCFKETERQFQVNLSNAKWLIDNLGDDPETWPGKQVTLYLASFEYEGETKQGIRIRLPGASDQPQRGDGSVQILPPRKGDMDDSDSLLIAEPNHASRSNQSGPILGPADCAAGLWAVGSPLPHRERGGCPFG